MDGYLANEYNSAYKIDNSLTHMQGKNEYGKDTFKNLIEVNSKQPWGVRRIVSPNRVEHQLFPEEYFSGSDITIYMGDIFVSDISRFEFTLQEAVKPIFSYASYTWDCVARGSRMIQGTLTIPFKESGYLSTILGHIGQLVTNNTSDKALPMIARLMNEGERDSLIENNKPPEFVADVREDIEGLLERYQQKEGFTEEFAYKSRNIGYEREVWGRLNSQDKDRRYQTYFYVDRNRVKSDKQDSYDWQKTFKDKGPNIYITYGALDASVKEQYAIAKTGTTFPHTVKALYNVQFNSIGQIINSDGKPIEEVYTFIAQDMD